MNINFRKRVLLNSISSTNQLLIRKFRTTTNHLMKVKIVSKNISKPKIVQVHHHLNDCNNTKYFTKSRKMSYEKHNSNIPESEPTIDGSNIRFNPLGIQMISSSLRQKIFGNFDEKYDKQKVEEIIKQLRAHGLTSDKLKPNLILKDINEEIEKYLPKFISNDLSKHFYYLGEKFSEKYKQLIFNLIESEIPDPPKQWVLREGWTRYTLNSSGQYITERVDYPIENDLVFDVEVCMKDSGGQRPTLATAVSSKAWYSWCSQRLINCKNSNKSSIILKTSLNDLIPFGISLDSERLIVGHNVSFDRTYIREQYDIKCDKTRFLDTLSLHMCVSGLTQHQRALSYSQKIKEKNLSENETNIPHLWKGIGSLNNLGDVYNLYCDDKQTISKDPRNIFIDGSIYDVFDNFEELMTYCAKDVSITYKILKSIFKKFLIRFPHPITFAGMLEMSVMYLPIIPSNWERYISDSESIYEIHERELNLTLREIANDICSLAVDQRFREDVWLWDLDWKTQYIKFKKPKPEKQKKKKQIKNLSEISERNENEETDYNKTIIKVMSTASQLMKRQPLMPGYPKWFLEFCSKYNFNDENEVIDEDMEDMEEWEIGPHLISTQMRSVPKLMRLMWNSYPLHYDEKHGWGYLTLDPRVTDCPHRVPGAVDDDKNTIYFPFKQFKEIIEIRNNNNNLKPNRHLNEMDFNFENFDTNSENKAFDDVIKGCLFYKLPHKGGPHKRVGNPLSKDFLKSVKDGSLTSFDNQLTDSIVYESKRLSYWKNASKRILSQIAISYNDKSGAILPRVIVAGTVTRRAVEQTWLTASNAVTDRLGSELKSMIQCPEGYCYVGADVDSQELWIASLIGDSHFSRIHGSTGIGWMTLQGDRANGTDMHSKTATSINISRDEAKVLNYARIYGSGQSFASRFLMQSNPNLSGEEAKEKAKKIFTETKGSKTKVKRNDKSIEKTIEKKRLWTNGTESQMFNKLEEIANSEEPKTPVLECRISRSLEPNVVKDYYMTSRVNWVVQSSAVDFLHIILVTMKWLFEEMQIEGRFSISIHDEVRYLVKEEHKYRAALALQLSNLLTRSFFSHKMGFNDLPLSVAFFSKIDIDKCLRKEVDMDSKTPSNPLGLRVGYDIPFGESLNILQLIEKLNSLKTSF